jgi:hypothetical protein
MSRDHNPPLRDVTADTENTACSIVACWTVFTELLPGIALIKSITVISGIQENSLKFRFLVPESRILIFAGNYETLAASVWFVIRGSNRAVM